MAALFSWVAVDNTDYNSSVSPLKICSELNMEWNQLRLDQWMSQISQTCSKSMHIGQCTWSRSVAWYMILNSTWATRRVRPKVIAGDNYNKHTNIPNVFIDDKGRSLNSILIRFKVYKKEASVRRTKCERANKKLYFHTLVLGGGGGGGK